VWEPKYGVVSAKFVTHQAGEAARVTNYPFYPLGIQFCYF
jgi:predicted amidohydrolase